MAHPAGHASALEHTGRGRARADGPGRAVLALRAVARAEALEVVTLHAPRRALALAGADDIDLRPGLEDLRRDLLAERELACGRRTQLSDVPTGRDTGLLEMTG